MALAAMLLATLVPHALVGMSISSAALASRNQPAIMRPAAALRRDTALLRPTRHSEAVRVQDVLLLADAAARKTVMILFGPPGAGKGSQVRGHMCTLVESLLRRLQSPKLPSLPSS